RPRLRASLNFRSFAGSIGPATVFGGSACFFGPFLGSSCLGGSTWTLGSTAGGGSSFLAWRLLQPTRMPATRRLDRLTARKRCMNGLRGLEGDEPLHSTPTDTALQERRCITRERSPGRNLRSTALTSMQNGRP